MCGIAGFQLSPTERPINTRALANDLLLGIEHRGKDATGVAWVTKRNKVQVQKSAMKASDFTRVASTARRTPSAILHTRAATQGSPRVNANNHPIQVGNIIGVHNGMVDNDYEVFADLLKVGTKRIAEVDSEAIFAALAHGGESVADTPLYGPDFPSRLEHVAAAAAIAFYDATDVDTLHLARLESNPLMMAQTEAGSLLFASELKVIEQTAKAFGLKLTWHEAAEEGEYYQVRGGVVTKAQSFKPKPYFSHRYNPTVNYSYNRVGTTPINVASIASKSLPAAKVRTLDLGNTYIAAEDFEFGRSVNSPSMDEAEAIYWNRMVEEDDLLDSASAHLTTNPDDYWALLEELSEAKVFLAVGDSVRTTLQGVTSVHGIVYSMPDSLEGSYILRLSIPHEKRGGYEHVFVEREASEFYQVSTEPLVEWLSKFTPDEHEATYSYDSF